MKFYETQGSIKSPPNQARAVKDTVVALHHKPKETLMPISFGVYENEAPIIAIGDQFSMLFVDQGLCIANINGKRHVLDSVGILCLNHHDQIAIERFESFRCITIQFNPKFIHEDFTIENMVSNSNADLQQHVDYYLIHPFIFKDKSYYGYIPVGPHSHLKIKRCFAGLVNELKLRQIKKNMCLCWSRSFLIETLIITGRMFYKQDYFAVTSEPVLPERTGTLSEKIILYLHSNYQKKITLKKLSGQFAINRTSLSDMVKRDTGMTVIDYLNKIRVRQACMLLLDSDRNISEICYQSGFGDLSHFGRTFKKIVGIAPSNYRAEYNTAPIDLNSQ